MTENSFRDTKLTDVFLVGYKAFADLAGKGVMFVITVAAARRLSAQAFGVFALASTLGWMLAVATDFGIQLHVARAVAREPNDAAAILAPWLRVRVWMTVTAIALVMLGLVVFRADASFAIPMLLFAIVYGGNGLIEFLNYYYRGLSRSDIESTLTLWQRGGTLALGGAVLLWRPSVAALAVAMLIPVALTLTASLRIARPLVPVPAPSLQPPTVTEFWSQVAPIGAGILLSALYFRVDVFLVEWWRGTEAVALYNAVFRLIEALRLFPAAVLAVTLPSLVNARDGRAVGRVSAGVTAFAIAVTAITWMGASTIIPMVYGRAFVDAIPAFRILTLSFPLLSLNYALTHQLVAWNGQRAYAAICAVALGVNIALNARLIPALSIDGAAWATVGTELFLTFACGVVLMTMTSRQGAAIAAAGSAV